MKGSKITTPGVYWWFDETYRPQPRWRLAEISAFEDRLFITLLGARDSDDLLYWGTTEFVGPIQPPGSNPGAGDGVEIVPESPSVRRFNLEGANDLAFPLRSARRVCQFDVFLSKGGPPLEIQFSGEPVPTHPEMLPAFINVLADAVESSGPRWTSIHLMQPEGVRRLSLTTALQPDNMTVEAFFTGVNVPVDEATLPAFLRKLSAVVEEWLNTVTRQLPQAASPFFAP